MPDATVAERVPTAAEHAADMADYMREGQRLGREIGNRGPVRFKEGTKLADDILDAYWRHGFYVFENVIDERELDELRSAMADTLDRAPVGKDAEVDAKGRPALGGEFKRPTFTYVKPLSDPVGGTNQVGGRHPSKMVEPDPGKDAPAHVVHLVYGMCRRWCPGAVP